MPVNKRSVSLEALNSIVEHLTEYAAFQITTPEISSLPYVITDSRITSNHIVAGMYIQTNMDLTWETNDSHQLILSGTLASGATIGPLKITLVKMIT